MKFPAKAQSRNEDLSFPVNRSSLRLCAFAGVIIFSLLVARPIAAQSTTQPEREELLNGLRLLFWPQPGRADVILKLRINSGAAFDLAGKSRVWMVDPLDGTNGFIDGNGDFAVQIGLVEHGEPVIAVVYLPLADTLYRAVIGDGTWIERPQHETEKVRVSDHKGFAEMRLAASRSHRSPRMNRVVQRFGFRDEVQRGSVGIKIGLLIEQQCDVYIHLSPRTKQWDTCAPQLILTEAGGRLTDLFGQPLNYNVPDVNNRNGLVASNGVAHDLIIRTLAPLLAEFGRKPV